MGSSEQSWDNVTFEEIASSIASPFVLRLLAFINENEMACAQAAWRKSSAEEIYNEAELAGFARWDNRTKVDVLIGCAQTAAEAKKIATHVDKALTLFTYTDCLARYLMGIGVRLNDRSAVDLIEAYGRRMKGHRLFPFFGTRHGTSDEEARDRRAFAAAIQPHLRPARLFGGGHALAAFKKVVFEALPLPDADHRTFALLVGPDEAARWDAQVKELARRKADADDVEKLDRDKVLAQVKEAIAEFGSRHESETFYAFALDATMLCLDSVEQYATKIKDPYVRASYLSNPSKPPVDAGDINPGDFEYQGFVDIGDQFPSLRLAYGDYFAFGLERQHGRFYAEFAQWLTEKLVADKSFECLRRTTPFHVSWSMDND